jgi:hypothetical protein
MTLKTNILLVVIVILLPGFAGAGGVTEKDFVADTTEDLLNLCNVSPDDPLYNQAIGFCHGYLVGAYHYYEAQSSGPKGIKFVCPPDPVPSRNDSINMFIEWAKAHPQYWQKRPVDTEFRFLAEKWSCKP